MRLYGHPRSVCTRKILLTVAEKGHELELVWVDLVAGEHNRPAHLARHPFAKIPVLEDGEFLLYESSAIMRYLDQKLFGMRLTPSLPRELGRMEQWLSVESAYLAPAIWTLRGQLQVLPRFGQRPDPSDVRRAQREITEVLAVLERALAGDGSERAYLAGPSFTLADIAFAPSFALLARLGQSALLAQTPCLRQWWARVEARATWQRVLREAEPKTGSKLSALGVSNTLSGAC